MTYHLHIRQGLQEEIPVIIVFYLMHITLSGYVNKMPPKKKAGKGGKKKKGKAKDG